MSMKKRESIANIMTKQLVTVELNETLLNAKHLMAKNKVRHIPVVEGKKLVGILSRTDIMRLSFGNVFENQENADDAILEMLSIEQVMSHKPLTVKVDLSIKEVAGVLAEKEFHALPVVEGDDEKLVGIITTTDVIKYMLSQY